MYRMKVFCHYQIACLSLQESMNVTVTRAGMVVNVWMICTHSGVSVITTTLAGTVKDVCICHYILLLTYRTHF